MKDEWKVVSVGPPAASDDPWKVVSVGLLPGETGVSPAKRSANERFEDNYRDAQRNTVGGALGDSAAAAAVPGVRDANRDKVDAYKQRSENDKFWKTDDIRVELPDKIRFPFAPGGEIELPDAGFTVSGLPAKAVAGAATLGGQIAGAVTSPEAILAPGRTLLTRMLGAGAVNAGADAAVQPMQKQSGVIEQYDPWRVVGSGVMGAGIQGGGELAAKGLKAAAPSIKEAGRRAGDAVRDFGETMFDGLGRIGDQPTPSRDPWAVVDVGPAPKPAAAKAASVDDVWGNLVKQESGNRQADKNGQLIRSHAGAGGVAQLMPATAKEVANKLGRPELADLAFQPTAEGRAANELLGRAYYGQMLDRFGGDHQLAAAAYNAGPGRVNKALKRHGREGFLAGLPAETQNYVRVVAGARVSDEAPVRYAGEPRVSANDLEEKLRFDEERTAAEDAARDARNEARQAANDTGAGFEPKAPEEPFVIGEPIKPAEKQPVGESVNDWGNRLDEANQPRPPERLDSDNPIPAQPTSRPEPELPQAPTRDLTDEALDLMRRGKGVRVNRGPSLLEFMQGHGLRDDGGELSNIGLDLWHRDKAFRKKLVREDGLTVGDMAVMAQERGYLPQRFSDDVDTRATPADLIEAMREEIAGRPRFAMENPEAQALRDHIDDLDQITNELGLDLDGMSNAEIKAAISRAFSEPDPLGRSGAVAALEAPRQPKVSPALARFRDRSAPIDVVPPDVLQSTRHGLSDQRQRTAVPLGQGAAYAGKSVGDMMKELRATLGFTHRQGRLRGKRSLGEYSRKSGVVRQKSMRDIETAVHEAGHVLEFTHRLPTLEAAMVKHAAKLKTLDYDPKAGRRHEGFAEFFRKYVNNPQAAERDAPDFLRDFEAALAKDSPKVLQMLGELRATRENLLKTDSVSALKSTVTEGGEAERGFMGKLLKFIGLEPDDAAGSLYQASFDRLFPIQKGVRILEETHLKNNGKRLELGAENNPYVLARNKVDAERAAVEDITNGVVPYHGAKSEGPSLREAIITAFGKNPTDEHRSDLDAYLIARRLVPEWDRFRRGELRNEPHLIGQDDLRQTIRDLEAKYPKIADAAQQVYEWNQNKLRKTFEAGFISKDAFDKLSKKPDYVPLYRDRSDLKGGSGNSRAGADASALPKTFRGSDRDIVSPLTSMMEDARVLARRIRENDVKGAFAKMADAAGPQGIDAVIERLPKSQLEGFRVNVLEALEKKAKELGLDKDEIDELMALNEDAFGNDPLTSIFRSVNLKPREGEQVVFHWKDGEIHPLQLPDGEFGKALYELLNNLHPDMQNVMVDIVAMGSATVRMTATTLNPEFFLVNLVRDQLDATVKTDVGYVPVVDAVRGLYHTFKNTDVAKRYRLAGGIENGTETVVLGERPRTVKDAANQKRNLTQRFHFSPNPVRWMTALADLSERGTRLGIYAKAEKLALKRGETEYGAMVQGAFEARDYYDPQRRGSKALTASRLVIFLNPYLQGWDKYGRVLTASGENPASLGGLARVLAPMGKRAPQTAAEKRALAHAYKAWIWTAGLATMSAGLTYLYFDDPEYQSIDSSTRSTNWVFKAPWSDQWHRIPKQQDIAVAANLAERLIEAKFANDPKALKKFVADLEFTLAPPHQIPLLSIHSDLARNRNFAGQKIIPDRLSNVDPEYQYTHYTSELAKMVGKATKQSPIKIDYVIKGLFSAEARYGLQGFDVLVDKVEGNPEVARSKTDTPILRRFNVDPNRSTLEAKDFYNLAGRDDGVLTRKKKTFDLIKDKNGGEQEAIAYLNELKPPERAYVIATTFGSMLPDGGKNAMGVKMRSEMFHPMVRANEAVNIISGVERDISDATLKTMDGREIALTPQQRRQALDALSALRRAELRNAMITTGADGWRQKTYADRTSIYERLGAVDARLPGLVKGLQDEEGIPRPNVALRGWNQLKPILEGKADGSIYDEALMAKRLKSSNRKTKREAFLEARGRDADN